MRLRAKTLAVLGITMLLLFVFLYSGAYLTLTQRYREVEENEAQEAGRRAADALQSQIDHLDSNALYWSANDATFELLDRKDPHVPADLLPQDALARQGFSFVVLLDQRDRVVHAVTLDLDLEVPTEPMPGFITRMEQASYLRTPGDPRGVTRGVTRLPGGTAIVVARPITTTDMYSPPNGTLIAGRYLDAGAADQLTDALGLPVAFFPAPSEVPVRAISGTATEGGVARQIWWKAVDAEKLHAFTLVNDIDGQPVLLLRTALSRDTRAGMQSAITAAFTSLLLVCVAATATAYLLVNWAVVRPVVNLSEQLQSIARRGDTSQQVHSIGSGELRALGNNVNRMLSSLEMAESQLRHSRDELEHRVEERTQELKVSNAKHLELIECMADAVFSVDLDGHVTLVNERAAELTGRSRDELLGKPFIDLMTMGSSEQIHRHLNGVPAQGESWTVEALLHSKGGDPVPVELRAAPFSDADGAIAGTQWIARDMTERVRYESQLVHLASHDALTGLANRRSFESALERALADAMRRGHRGAVVWLDLDDFKDINDTLGHAAGDEALSMLATMLSRDTRGSDVLARVGGDEFAILMPRVTREEAEAAAGRVLNAIVSYTFAIAGHSVRAGASLGVVFFPDDGTTVQEVLSNADAAMYRAKEAGRSTVWVKKETEDAELHISRMRWNERIHAALEQGSFKLFAQPIWRLNDGREVVRHELLIRMVAEEGHLYPPSEFLPVAERLGLIKEIDRWVLQQAIAILEDEDHPIRATEVNLSGKAFADATLVQLVASELRRTGIDPRRLGFEITETAAIADMSSAQWFIQSLKQLGCRFSLDDFGTGFSSFHYLKHLPIDCIKIDGSFVRGLSSSNEDRCLVRGICEMCRGLGVEVLAECVEDEQTLQAVVELGVDYAQGFYLGRPSAVNSQRVREE